MPEKEACLVIDIVMPGMNGLTLYTELLKKGCRTPAIFITALDDPDLSDSAKRVGGVTVLQKPFQLKTLTEAMDKARRAANG